MAPGSKSPAFLTGMPTFAAVDMEGVAQRLAGLGADQDAPVSAPGSPAPQAEPCDTAPVTVALEAVPAALAAPDMPMQQVAGEADSCEVAALKEELEAAKTLAHAQQVRVCSHLMHLMYFPTSVGHQLLVNYPKGTEQSACKCQHAPAKSGHSFISKDKAFPSLLLESIGSGSKK